MSIDKGSWQQAFCLSLFQEAYCFLHIGVFLELSDCISYTWLYIEDEDDLE